MDHSTLENHFTLERIVGELENGTSSLLLEKSPGEVLLLQILLVQA
jgi:hypothetical protein